jgi:hypothetical protein
MLRYALKWSRIYKTFMVVSQAQAGALLASFPVAQGESGIMQASIVRSRQPAGRSSRIVGLLAVAAALPLAAHGSEVVTFDWVPTGENPTSAATTTAHGVLTLTLPSWSLTTAGNPAGPNYGPYYTGGAATTAEITGLLYTAADGLSVNLANVTTKSVTSSTWVTSSVDTPASGAFGVPSAGYYLVSAFTMSGTTPQGSPFMIANNTGTAGATYANGIGNGTNTFNTTTGTPVIPAVADGGFWEFQSATAVPLPSGLPLLLGGLGLLTWLMRRKGSFQVSSALAAGA